MLAFKDCTFAVHLRLMRKNSDSSYSKKSDNKEHKKDASRKSGGADNKSFRKDGASRPKREFDRDEKRPASDRPKRPYSGRQADRDAEQPKRTFRKRDESGESGRGSFERKPFERKERKPFDKKDKPEWKDRKPGGKKEWGDKKFDKTDRKPFDKKDRPDRGERKFDKGDRKPFKKRESAEGEDKTFERGDRKPFERRERADRGERKFDKGDRKPFRKREGDEGDEKKFDRSDRKPFEKRERADRGDKKFDKGDRKPFKKREGAESDDKPRRKFEDRDDRKGKEGGFKARKTKRGDEDRDEDVNDEPTFSKELPTEEGRVRRSYPTTEEKAIANAMTLNKYVAHSGECSRRDAAEMVKQGKVRVNGELVLEPGYRVVPGDQVTLSGKKLTPQRNLVYVLLNKPKGYITTTEDPEERKTVMDLVSGVEAERLFPVGRLDRNTTGVLLLTNDGPLAHRLAHPSYNIKKIYQVTLDKNLTRADYEKISKGLELEDGKVEVDAIAYLDNRHEIGIEIHSGKNRIVRRIFESLGYVVEKLDRVMYAGLTKKNVSRGKWRLLTEREVILLKHFKS